MSYTQNDWLLLYNVSFLVIEDVDSAGGDALGTTKQVELVIET